MRKCYVKNCFLGVFLNAIIRGDLGGKYFPSKISGLMIIFCCNLCFWSLTHETTSVSWSIACVLRIILVFILASLKTSEQFFYPTFLNYIYIYMRMCVPVFVCGCLYMSIFFKIYSAKYYGFIHVWIGIDFAYDETVKCVRHAFLFEGQLVGWYDNSCYRS